MVDGKKVEDEAHKLTIKADIVEDFSGMSVEDKQQAPIIEVPASVELGKAVGGKVLKGKIELKNIGVNPLEIRRVYSTAENLSFKTLKPIKSGKKGVLTVEVNTKGLEAGAYSREVVIISNDYANSIKKIKVNFTVE